MLTLVAFSKILISISHSNYNNNNKNFYNNIAKIYINIYIYSFISFIYNVKKTYITLNNVNIEGFNLEIPTYLIINIDETEKKSEYFLYKRKYI